ncbi:MAG: hypothetical protein QOG48_2478 [Verrucomicrobiota bacterium]|jgi:hypothetical protein
MKFLAEKIADRLKDHKSCTIFENDLQLVWPIIGKALQLREQRNTLIKAFAKAHGWNATIRDPGIRVVFRKLKPGEKDADSRKLAKAS